ncbi:imidazoleglycerol phosphate synthase, cyclase subunit [Cryptococcus depauperatus]
MRVAVIGSGLAGLTTAYLLSREGVEVYLVERVKSMGVRAGKVIKGETEGANQIVDVPMRGFQGGYYPLLLALYRHLGLSVVAVSYRFSFSSPDSTYFIHSGNSGASIPSLPLDASKSVIKFCQALTRLLGVALCYLLLVVLSLMAWHDLLPVCAPDTTLRQLTASVSGFLARPVTIPFIRYTIWTPLGDTFKTFVETIVLPLFSAVGTMTLDDVWNLSAKVLLEYVHTTLGTLHYLLAEGYTSADVARLLSVPVKGQGIDYIRLDTEVTRLEYAVGGGMRVLFRSIKEGASGEEESLRVDRVVLATQASVAKRLLGEVEVSLRHWGEEEERRRVLKMVRGLEDVSYRETIVINHQDFSILPAPRDQREINLYVPYPSKEIETPSSPYFPPTSGNVYTMATQIILPQGQKGSKPILQTTNPTLPIKADKILSVSRLERALPLKNPAKTLKHLCAYSPNSLVYLAGSYVYPGIPLLEGCVGSARRVVEDIVAANRYHHKKELAENNKGRFRGKLALHSIGGVDWEAGKGASVLLRAEANSIAMANTSLPIPAMGQPSGHSPQTKPKLYILDYGAGNVRSLANSIKKLGYEFEWIKDPSDFDKAEKLIFPGVGSFAQATASLRNTSLHSHLLKYISSGKPYFGICIGMQVLFASSTESPGSQGLGVIPFAINEFKVEDSYEGGKGKKSVPHMGWNRAWHAWKSNNTEEKETLMLDEDYYFVHSFAALLPSSSATAPPPEIADFAYTLSRYGSETFVSSVQKDNVFAVQFHPEKSGPAGLDLLRRWLEAPVSSLSASPSKSTVTIRDKTWQPSNPSPFRTHGNGLTNRVVACLDVRSNDAGDLVVTKGDQYDVREKSEGNHVRNLGKPVELARRYCVSGADEIAFLNITSFRSSALLDQPMLDVVRTAAETVFVPLTIGGGIKDTVDPDGTPHTALEVAGAYFRSGADKVSIGSEAVIAVEEMLERETRGENPLTGKTGIETISKGYGRQAVVVSIDPKRVYVDTTLSDWLTSFPQKHRASLIIGDNATSRTAPQEKGKAWWYQCTVSGGRAVRDIDVVQLAQGVERLGAGEILLNSVDRDGSGQGFDLDLIKLVKDAVGIPVVSSSGAGSAQDFEEVFRETGTEAALAAGIFHRSEVEIQDVKEHLKSKRMTVRICALDTI